MIRARVRSGALIAALLALACGDGPADLDLPRQEAFEALELSAEVASRHVTAGDSFDVTITIANTATRRVVLDGPDACIVSSVDVNRAGSGDLERTPAFFVGSGARSCDPNGTLRIAPGDSIVERVRLVAWEDPAPAEYSAFTWYDGPPYPTGYRVAVSSAPLGQTVESVVSVLSSGLISGYGEVCGEAPDGPGPVEIVVRPTAVGAALRVRYEIHNISQEDLLLKSCGRTLSDALDRRGPDGWIPGAKPNACPAINGPVEVESGTCLRSVHYGSYVGGAYRLRVERASGDGDLTSDVFRPGG